MVFRCKSETIELHPLMKLNKSPVKRNAIHEQLYESSNLMEVRSCRTGVNKKDKSLKV